ncbi:hypothetical protein ACTWQL_13740 [Pseudalkalibacillus sp. R45]|uniref:hypothetical protein n=1 Tax=Pseudalkalibacillus sp. R45 TaxID=3457433 RepID=UPI003FCD452D
MCLVPVSATVGTYVVSSFYQDEQKTYVDRYDCYFLNDDLAITVDPSWNIGWLGKVKPSETHPGEFEGDVEMMQFKFPDDYDYSSIEAHIAQDLAGFILTYGANDVA